MNQMKIVGIAGAQGAGKSTLLAELHRRDWIVDDFRVSRAVQKALGWESLTNVMGSVDTMKAFQREVFKQKNNHDMTLKAKKASELPQSPRPQPVQIGLQSYDARDQVILVERTFADVYAYTNLWTWKFVDQQQMHIAEGMEFLAEFARDCAFGHTLYDATLMLPFMDHIAWEDDPNRASRQDIEAVYNEIEHFMGRKVPLDHPKLVITKETVSDRADEVETFLQKLYG